MITRAVVCPECRRVVAVGAGLPATCFNAIAPSERIGLTAAALAEHPKAHRDCVELEVVVTRANLAGEELLAEVERSSGEQIAALASLVANIRPE
jgi:hypothetical protein